MRCWLRPGLKPAAASFFSRILRPDKVVDDLIGRFAWTRFFSSWRSGDVGRLNEARVVSDLKKLDLKVLREFAMNTPM